MQILHAMLQLISNMLQLPGLGWHRFSMIRALLLSLPVTVMLVIMIVIYCCRFIITITIVSVAVAVAGVTTTVILMIVSVGSKVVVNASEVDMGMDGQLK